jgi:micrococcal nuclease
MPLSTLFFWPLGPIRLARALALCALLAGVSVPPAVAQAPLQGAERPGERLLDVYEGRVSRVSDGDTLWVKPLAGGRYRKLRLDGLDAPEICQPGGVAARDALAQRLLGQVVTVRVRAFDDYGRAVARLEQGDLEVGAWLVREGHAWSSRWRGRPSAYADEEALARGQRRGVFQTNDAEEPRAFRRRHGPCQIPSVSGGESGGLRK